MNRKHPRRPVDRPAKIYVGGTQPLACRVRDISEGGVRLHVAWKGCLPKSFDLADAFANTRRTVRVVWVGLSGMGVCFADESQGVGRSGFGRRTR